MKEKLNIGIDLGGSHVGIGVVDKKGIIIEQHEKDFTLKEKENLMEVAIKYIIEIVNKLKEKYTILKVGIGIAGTISNGIIIKAVNLGINNFNIKNKLEKEIGLKVNVRNDAKCAAIAEYKFTDLNKYTNVLFLTLGTGIGGSYIYNKQLMEGKKFEGCEFGHIIIKEDGIKCKCGKKGCFERYGSILYFKNKVIDRLNLPKEISGPELRKNIDSSKEKIKDIIDEYIKDLSIGLSNLINIFEPDCTVIGGGFARYDYLFLEELKRKILDSNLLFNPVEDIIIRTARLGNDAGIIGASQL